MTNGDEQEFLTQSFTPRKLSKPPTTNKNSTQGSVVSLKSLLNKNTSERIIEEPESFLGELERGRDLAKGNSFSSERSYTSSRSNSGRGELFPEDIRIGHGNGINGREGTRPRRASTAKSFASTRTFASGTTVGSSIQPELPDTRFSALRTFHSSSSSLSNSNSNSNSRERLAIPERKKGDWACWGRVIMRVVVLGRGGLEGERSRKGKIRVGNEVREWFCEGVLWVTKVRLFPFPSSY